MNVAEKAYSLGIRKATIGFSTGKDSVVGLDMMIKAGIEPVPIYFYIVPELEFIENNIKLYENHFGVKVGRMPHPILYDYIRNIDWQPYGKVFTMYMLDIGSRITFEMGNKEYLSKKKIEGVEYDCNCMKMSDSLNRRLLLRKLPDIDTKKKIIYLAKYMTDKDIFEYMKQNNIPLTDDYKIFGRSWDGLSYHFLYGVHKHYPRDYETIKSYFPLIDAELFRYKLVNKYRNEE